ncbi:MAG: hypothetical protein H6741_03730 [Alphaproteobacteria bacterium]|nr:hypothetical protein [Alphaproteobacteria bacterium]
MNTRSAALGLLLLSAACAARDDRIVHDGPEASLKGLSAVGLAPALFLQDMEGALGEQPDPFEAGLYLGHVTNSGGFVRELTEEEGSPVRSKEYTFTAQDAYRQQAQEWLDVSLGEALTADKLSWSRLPGLDASAVPTPVRRRVRGSNELDGTDNVNLPRFTLEPQPLAGGDALGGGFAAYVVPIVVYYYSHNGGWFIGQDKGCGGGARARVLITLYDAASGRVLSWRDVDVRSINNYVNQPNGAQIDDFLIETEAKFAKQISKSLFP